jgi:hypothetical protein
MVIATRFTAIFSLLLFASLQASFSKHLGGYNHKGAASARRKAKYSAQVDWGSLSERGIDRTTVLADLRHSHVVRRRIRYDQRSVGWGTYKAGYYTTFEDVRDNSEYFVAVPIGVPDVLVNIVRKASYPIPFVRTLSNVTNRSWCEETSRKLTEKRKAENGAGSYHSCVLSSHMLPKSHGTSELGRLSGDHLSKYFDLEFLNQSCVDLQIYKPPSLMEASSIPVPSTFMLYTRDALVLDTGSVHSITSGFTEHFQGPRGCYHWSELDAGSQQCNKGAESKFDLKERKYKSVQKLFVITQVYGDRIFHFIAECLPRLAFVYQELLADDEIKIHIQTKKFKFATQFLQFLGFPGRRIVSGSVRAKEVYVPEGTSCGEWVRKETRGISCGGAW